MAQNVITILRADSRNKSNKCFVQAGRQAGRQRDRQTDRWGNVELTDGPTTDSRLTDRLMDRKAGGSTSRPKDRQTNSWNDRQTSRPTAISLKTKNIL